MNRGPRLERGSALVEFSWLAILLMIPVLWLVLAVFDVQRGAFAVSAAARSAGRAYVLAESDALGRSRAEQAAQLALTDQGVATGFTLEVRCVPYAEVCHAAGSVVTVTVSSNVQLPWLPTLFGNHRSFAVEAAHTVPIGQFQEPADDR